MAPFTEEYEKDYKDSPFSQLLMRYLETNQGVTFAEAFCSSTLSGESGLQDIAATGIVFTGNSANCQVTTTQLELSFTNLRNGHKLTKVSNPSS